MKENEITFSVKMTVKQVFRFNIYHTYHNSSGRVGLLLSLLALANLVISFDTLTDQGKTIMTIIGLWFTVLEPLMIHSRAKKQVKRTKSYEKPLEYTIGAEGITVSQGEERQTMEWARIRKVVKTSSQILVYSSRVHAFIFPRMDLGEKETELVRQLNVYAKEYGIRINRRFKRNF